MSKARVEDAQAIAEGALSGDRLLHVHQVGATARRVTVALGLPWSVVEAAWLHDVGYASGVALSQFHPLDGARWLQGRGWDAGVVGLVAYHSGAAVEAEERGLSVELAVFCAPEPAELDALTYSDMTTSPVGEPVSVQARLADILARYVPEHPVHRAVTRSGPDLIAAVVRVEKALASADVDLAIRR